jgi:RNA polymerase sigma factor (sigma-70 family)
MGSRTNESSGERKTGHPWEKLEASFQRTLPVLFGERQPESREEEAAIKQIRLALVATASRIFRSPRMSIFRCDPEAAANRWFIAIRAAKQRYDPRRPFHKYAYPVLSWTCCDLCRHERRRWTERMPANLISSIATPLTFAISREERERIREALRTLKRNGEMSREQRTAIALKYYRGLSSKQAGERCGVSAATIDMRLYQARKILLKHLCNRHKKAA